MSENALKSLDVGRGLELLKRLDGTLDAFAKEERELARELRLSEREVEREAEERVAAAVAEDARGAGATREFLEAERARLAEVRAGRRERIEVAGRDALRTLPVRAQKVRERWLGELQMRHVSRSRELAAERGAAEEGRAEAVLAGQAVRLRKLRGRARDSFTGFLSYLVRLQWGKGAVETTGDVETALDEAERELAEFRELVLPRVLSFAPLPVSLGAVGFAVYWFGEQAGTADWTRLLTVGGLVGVGLVALHVLARVQSRERAGRVVSAVHRARAGFAAARLAAETGYEGELKRIADEEAALEAEIGNKMERADEEKAGFAARERERLRAAVPRALARNEELVDARLARLEREVGERLTKLEAAGRSAGEAARAGNAEARGVFEAERERRWGELVERWESEIQPIYAEIGEVNALAAEAFPEWTTEFVEGWEPTERFLLATKFARLEVEVPMAADSRLELPGSREVSIPLALTFPETGSLLFETPGAVDGAVMSCLNQVILRLLATTPPGKLSFTILDPVGLGQNFAGLMHLGDYEESLITRRIWTQPDQIEERLAELNAHIEKVIQMYLRDEYATIAEYNERAGSTAEKYHFLVIADFPAGFSETAVKRLQSVITSGPRCGVHTLIHWDRRQALPTGFPAEELRSSSVGVQGGRDGLTLDCGTVRADARLALDAAPSAELGLKFIEVLGSASVDSNRVEVPFDQIAPEVLWEGDTTRELRVAIGRSGATKQQMLAIGKGTRQHALIAGKTGSGKSTLFHVIVTNLALTCSPREVEFYLIDFKKGVEFKCYASKRLPHARVVAVESDREFGLSVLERLDEELRRRGDLFRKAGVQDLAGYRREAESGEDFEALPRTLLMIDEFQEFFVEDDATAQSASVLLDRIVRQGRAFGIHVILGSQTLGGAYSLARATLGQMAIRVALQCNEADAYLIMDDDNAAPRLLSRPGEGIYNDASGAMEGNSPFQVCWLSDEERDAQLDRVRAMAEASPEMDAAPVVFEGNAPAEVREESGAGARAAGASDGGAAGGAGVAGGAEFDQGADRGPVRAAEWEQSAHRGAAGRCGAGDAGGVVGRAVGAVSGGRGAVDFIAPVGVGFGGLAVCRGDGGRGRARRDGGGSGASGGSDGDAGRGVGTTEERWGWGRCGGDVPAGARAAAVSETAGGGRVRLLDVGEWSERGLAVWRTDCGGWSAGDARVGVGRWFQ